MIPARTARLARLGPRPPLGYFSPTEEAAARLLRETLRPYGDVRRRNASAWLPPVSRLRRNMRRYDDTDEVDMVVIGCSDGGATVTQRLAHAGWHVVCLESGSHHLYWNEPRRLHPSDFHTKSLDGVGADWPITYDDLKPYYTRIERELPVAGPVETHVPDAITHGAEIRDRAMATYIETEGGRRATGVRYAKGGRTRFQRARAVAVAGHSIETPRLLLNSALAGSDDQVGRYVMVHGAPQTAGRFADEIRRYEARLPEFSTEAFYETDPAQPYRRGFSVQHITAHGHWAVLGALCEFLPQPDNRVTLSPGEYDRNGMPVARLDHSRCANDDQLMAASQQVMADILRAAGATELTTVERYAHLVGGCRMAATPHDGVVDADLRVFGYDNLFITDGSVLPTEGAADPALTVMALADRAADRLIHKEVPRP